MENRKSSDRRGRDRRKGLPYFGVDTRKKSRRETSDRRNQ